MSTGRRRASGYLVLDVFALVVLVWPWQGSAQFTDPRQYENFPVGVNQLEFTYAYAHSDALVDTALVIADAKLNLNQITIGYTRYFNLFHRMAWIEPSIPLAALNGSISGSGPSGSVSGAGDTSYEIAVLLKGGRVLSVAEFKDYKPTTTVGLSLAVTPPTGLYNPDKVLNLGSDRWSFKPELGVSCPFGPQQKWALDAYANSYFYTDNTSYHGTEILRQQPLPGFEGHLSYSFIDSLLGSLDARYSFRGTTSVDSVSQNNSQNNFILGAELIWSLNAKNSLSLTFEKALVHENGPEISGLSVKYDYYWGKDYK
jgi:Putative MetA-pathway of phenol degradation